MESPLPASSALPAWDDLRVLLALHRQRSFLAAGRALGISTSTAARRVGALEAALGRRLVLRATSGTTLEPDALALVALAEQLEHGLDAMRRDEPGRERLAGTVRISIGEGFARWITQVLTGFRRTHPETLVELVIEQRLSDVARREADLAVRTGRSSSKVVVERALGAVRFAPYASTAYVERRLRTRRLRRGELGAHDFVGYDGPLRAVPQHRWLVERGAVRFPFRTNSDIALIEAVTRGEGIGMLPERVARDLDELVPLAADDPLPSIDVFLVMHRDLRKVPRIQAVARAIAEAFRRG